MKNILSFLQTLKTSKQKYSSNEVSVAHFIPYKCHWNSDTVLTHNGGLVRVVKLDGFAFETADDEDVDIKKNDRNNLFKGMATGSFTLWFHTVRRKEAAFPDGEMTSTFAKKVNREWKQRHDVDRSFVNEHYVSIYRQEDKSGFAFIKYLAKFLQQKADKSAWEAGMREAFDEIDEVTERVLSALNGYNPRLLGIVETEDGTYSEVLEFLGKLVNCGASQPMQVPKTDLDHYIPNTRLFFGPRSIEARGVNETRYAGIVSLKEYSAYTHAGILDGFLQLPFEFIMTQSFSFVDRMIAISSMQLQQRRLIQTEDVAKSQIAEISSALDAAMSGAYAFGSHHLTILCVERNIKALENALSMALVELANTGVNAVREKLNMEPAYWAQLPGNMGFATRAATINTMNLAGFASFHNYPSGKRKGNHWGDAVTVFNTVSGTPYFFSFHVRDVGHTMIIGPTGSGKTVLMNFLCAQSQKFNCRMFFFDKDRGAEIFIRALGGKYRGLSTSESSGFNPFSLPDTMENRTFLVELMKTLVSYNGEIVTPEEMDRIKEAVDGNYKLPKGKRVLRNIVPFLGIAGPGSLAGRIGMWHNTGSHHKLFDNEEDIIDFFSGKTFGFEMGEMLRDQIALGPVLLYLFHRIQQSLDGTPTMIILDEAWALIDNPIFAPKIRDWLKVLRKLNAFVVFATQSVEDASKSKISDTLVQQTSTQIFLPNLKATDVYKKVFMLSDREFTLVKTTNPSTRFFLVKQDNDGVIARVNLKGMDEAVRVLSGRAETTILLDKIIEEIGSDDPDDWLDIYYERSAEID